MNKLPLARNTDIVVQDLDKEILVYDLKTHKAFNLNETSALVYRACDGKTSFDDLKKKHGFSDDLIFLALDELKRAKLVKADEPWISPFAGMSRREAIRKVGLGTMIALPLISSLIAPTAAQAQSNTGVCSAVTPVNCNCVVSQAAYDSGTTTCTDASPCDPNCACQTVFASSNGNGTVTIFATCETVSS